jgi:N-acetylneuraminate synthase
MIISTGMMNLAEMDETVRTIKEAGCNQFVLLKCTSTYPATPTNTNISTIPHMMKLFHCPIGLSDHTMGIGVSVASVALGAVVIEKHFTLSRAEGGVDSTFSLEPDELSSLVIETERAWQSLGNIHYGLTDAEQPSLKFRRSLYIAEDMKAGDALDSTNLRAIRPGSGLPPKYQSLLMGKLVNQDIKKGTPVTWDLI